MSGTGGANDTAGNDGESATAAPADSPTNAVISILIGVGLFVFMAPVRVPSGSLFGWIIGALGVFARGVTSRATWAAQWQSLPIYSSDDPSMTPYE